MNSKKWSEIIQAHDAVDGRCTMQYVPFVVVSKLVYQDVQDHCKRSTVRDDKIRFNDHAPY